MNQKVIIPAMIAVPVLAGALAGSLWAAVQEPTYEATAQLTVGASTASVLAGNPNISSGDTRTMQLTQSRLLRSPAVASAFEAQHGFMADVVVETITDSSLIAVTSSASSPERAAATTNDYVQVYLSSLSAQVTEGLKGTIAQLTQQRDAVASQVAALSSGSDDAARLSLQGQLLGLNERLQSLNAASSAPPLPVYVAAAATPPAEASNMSVPRAGLLGALLGAFIAAGLLWLRHTMAGRGRHSSEWGGRADAVAHSSDRQGLETFRLSTLLGGTSIQSEVVRFRAMQESAGAPIPVISLGFLDTGAVTDWLNRHFGTVAAEPGDSSDQAPTSNSPAFVDMAEAGPNRAEKHILIVHSEAGATTSLPTWTGKSISVLLDDNDILTR